jgi:putative chitinase
LVTLITGEQLYRLAPNAVSDYLVSFQKSAAILDQCGINTPLRVAHFMAQVLHETGGLSIREEDLWYSAEGIVRTWPSRFATIADATPYAHNPKALADKVYNGRLGNVSNTDDGYNYRGRGLLQITGRDSYDSIGSKLTIPLTQAPSLAVSSDYGVAVAANEWQSKGCSILADEDNLKAITIKINGGLIGIDSRAEWLSKTKAVWLNPAQLSSALAREMMVSLPIEAPLVAASLARADLLTAVVIPETAAQRFVQSVQLEFDPFDVLPVELQPIAVPPAAEVGMLRALDAAVGLAPALAMDAPVAASAPEGGVDFQNGVQQAFVVGQHLISFDANVTADLRRACSTSTLFAQLYADRLAPRTDANPNFENWYSTYAGALGNIGWNTQSHASTESDVSSTDVEVDKAILTLATGVLGAGTAAIAMITAVLNSLKQASQNTPFLTLFESQSHTAKTAQFQVSIGTQSDADGFTLTTLMFRMTTTDTITQVLFFKWSTQNAEFKYQKDIYSIDQGIYDSVSAAVESKVQKYAQSFIQSVNAF